ncbi:MAG: hypothetical protein JXB26_13430 [Candidatus Aminicenantes bacterium]|nr:hypothetical protein [Candidatus Aminicenantes bacterium]
MNIKHIMKSLIITVITITVSLCLFGLNKNPAISKEEIIKKSLQAMFGNLKNEELKSIYVEGFFHGSEIPNRMTVMRPHKFRNDVRGGILVFDGEKAAWVKRNPDENGNPRPPELIESEYWRHFEVDIALIFPAFFDYDSEYRGIKKIDGHPYYEIYVKLPMGSYLSYFIDPKDFLVKRRLVSWDGKPDDDLWENIIDKYLDYEGIKFPDGYSFKGREGMEKGIYKNLKINLNPDKKLFLIPKDLK